MDKKGSRVACVTGYSVTNALAANDLDMFCTLVNTRNEIPLSYLVDSALKGADQICDYIIREFELNDTKNLMNYLSIKLGLCSTIDFPEILNKVLRYLSSVAYGNSRSLEIYHWASKGMFSYILQFSNKGKDEYLTLLNKEILEAAKEMTMWSGSQAAECVKDYHLKLRRKIKKPKAIEFSNMPDDEGAQKDAEIMEQLLAKQNAQIEAMSKAEEPKVENSESKYVKRVLTMEERLRIAGFNVREVVDWACKKEGFI